MKAKLGLNILTAIVLFLFSVWFVVVSEVGASGKSGKENILATYGKLPLNFIENKGQLDSKVRFYVKTFAQTLYFTDEGIVFDLLRSANTAGEGTKNPAKGHLSPKTKTERLVFNLGFENAAQGILIEGFERQAGEINSFTGNDRIRWKTGIPVYKGVVYKEIYKGIDLKIFGNGSDIEYEFIVNPGGNPDDILLTYDGIDGLRKSDDGELLIATAFGQLKETRPYIYQEITGRTSVDGSFEIRSPADQSQAGKYSYGFQVAAYDPIYPLIIDPVLSYSTYLGGSNGDDVGKAIAIDTSGSAYVTGYTSSSDFPRNSAYQNNYGGGSYDVFVTKLTSAGTALSYSTYLGGSGADYGTGIAVDTSGNACVVGYTDSTNFPTVSPYQGSLAGTQGWPDVFVSQLSSTGSLSYSTYLGGSGSDFGYGIAVDTSGNAYVTGNTSSPSSGTGTIPFPTRNGRGSGYREGIDPFFGTGDAFVSKINPGLAGDASLVYSTYLGGTGVDFGYGIAVDTSNKAYVTGYTTSTDFPPAGTPYQAGLLGTSDAFVAKIDPGLVGAASLIYTTYLGGGDIDSAYGIAVDTSGYAYVTGYTISNDFPTSATAYQKTVGGVQDAFVTKLNQNGSALSYSTYLGGSSADYGTGISLDVGGRACVAGYTSSGNFPTKNNPYQAAFAGWTDGFITKLNPAGNALSYSTYLGGSSSDYVNGIAVDTKFGYAYVSGLTYSTDFPLQNPYQGTNVDGTDAFVTKAGTLPTCTGCTGDPVNLTGQDYPSGTDCICSATTRINVGPSVIVRSGARIVFSAPIVDYKPGVTINAGAIVTTPR